MYKIALVDQHDLFRNLFRCLIQLHTDYEICINTNCLSKLKYELHPKMVDILVTDIEPHSKEDWKILRKTSLKYPELKIMVLSNEIKSDYVQKVMECGVKGYYSKTISHNELLEAIKEISNSDNSYDLKLGPRIREKFSGKESQLKAESSNVEVNFSQRELQILDLVCLEYSNNQISEILNLSKRTVEVHRSRIIKKTGRKSMVGAVLYAVNRNLIKTNF